MACAALILECMCRQCGDGGQPYLGVDAAGLNQAVGGEGVGRRHARVTALAAARPPPSLSTRTCSAARTARCRWAPQAPPAAGPHTACWQLPAHWQQGNEGGRNVAVGVGLVQVHGLHPQSQLPHLHGAGRHAIQQGMLACHRSAEVAGSCQRPGVGMQRRAGMVPQQPAPWHLDVLSAETELAGPASNPEGAWEAAQAGLTASTWRIQLAKSSDLAILRRWRHCSSWCLRHKQCIERISEAACGPVATRQHGIRPAVVHPRNKSDSLQ